MQSYLEHALDAYPNPNANFGPQFTPSDDPAPAERAPDAMQSPTSEQAAALLRQDLPSSSSLRGSVSVTCL